MNITTAKKTNIPDIINLISECIRDMEARGIYQWNDYYPTAETIAKDVDGKSLYMLQNTKDCLGILSLNEEQDAEYAKIKWLSDKSPVLVVHRLAPKTEFHVLLC